MIIHVSNTVCLLTNDLSRKILSGSGSTCPGPGPLDLVRVRISVKDDEPDVKRGWYVKKEHEEDQVEILYSQSEINTFKNTLILRNIEIIRFVVAPCQKKSDQNCSSPPLLLVW